MKPLYQMNEEQKIQYFSDLRFIARKLGYMTSANKNSIRVRPYAEDQQEIERFNTGSWQYLDFNPFTYMSQFGEMLMHFRKEGYTVAILLYPEKMEDGVEQNRYCCKICKYDDAGNKIENSEIVVINESYQDCVWQVFLILYSVERPIMVS